jgi:hypothetical protein
MSSLVEEEKVRANCHGDASFALNEIDVNLQIAAIANNNRLKFAKSNHLETLLMP